MTTLRQRLLCAKHPRTVFALFLVLMFFSGCSKDVDDLLETTGSADSHEAEHLEHFVPAHKPADFERLVQQLTERIPRLAAAVNETPRDAVEAQRTELADVIGWIPELAANSELRRKDFEKALRTSQQLRAEFAIQFESTKVSSPDVSKFARMLADLEELVPASRDEIF